MKFVVKSLVSEFESTSTESLSELGDLTIMSRNSPQNSGTGTPQGPGATGGSTLGPVGTQAQAAIGPLPPTQNPAALQGRAVVTAPPRGLPQDPSTGYLAQHFKADFSQVEAPVRKALFQEFLNFSYLESKFGTMVRDFAYQLQDCFQVADSQDQLPTKAEMKRLANSAKEVDLLLSKVDESVDNCMRQFAQIRNQPVQQDTDWLRHKFLQMRKYWGDEFQIFFKKEISITEQENVQKLSMFRLKPLALSTLR